MDKFIDWWTEWIVFLPLNLGERQTYKIIRLLCAAALVPWFLVIAATGPVSVALMLIESIGEYVNAKNYTGT